MTWYADHIFAQPTPSVLSAFCTAGSLSNSLYLVDDLNGHSWPRLDLRHNLPSQGLLVVCEVCNPNTHAAGWYGARAIHWTDSVSQLDVNVIRPEDTLSHADYKISLEAYPSLGLLRFLKFVSLSTHSNVSFYHASMWGGDLEEEFAWIFGDEDKVLVSQAEDYENVVEYQYLNHELISRMEFQSNVLTFTLRQHGVELPSYYFAPHTRGFAWEK
ncbi:hypothetical protein TFLX_01611 [Thermoflexales bacterium]|nr:hypothetical protein TFLX_01611 [Thermoflexales bacterium]